MVPTLSRAQIGCLFSQDKLEQQTHCGVVNYLWIQSEIRFMSKLGIPTIPIKDIKSMYVNRCWLTVSLFLNFGDSFSQRNVNNKNREPPSEFSRQTMEQDPEARG